MPLPLLKLLTGDPQAASLDTVHSVQIQSWLPTWLAPFLLAAVALAVIWRYRKQPRLSRGQRALLITLRVLAYAAALLIVARPVLNIDGEGVLDGAVPVILDASQSMELPDVENQPRYDAALSMARAMAAEQANFPDMELTFYRAGEDFGPWSPDDDKKQPDGDVTSINRMLADGQRDHLGGYMPGVVLLTDGAHNSGEFVDVAAREMLGAGVPVYSVGVGEERSRDLAIPFILAEDVVFKGETVRLFVNLTHRGYAGQTATVRLTLDDMEIAREDVPVGEQSEISVPMEYIPERVGNFILRAEVVPKADEVTEVNNVYQKNIRVIDEKIRVLAVFGTPTREYLYLRGALERDNRVELSVFLQNIDPRIISRGADKHLLTELPITAETFTGDYDLIILSAINVMLLPPATQEAMAGFVRDHAGGLVVISDSTLIPWSCRGTPLEPLIPVTISPGFGRSFREELGRSEKTEHQLRLTDEGEASQLVLFSGQADENAKIWESFPPTYRIYEGGRLKPGAVNLLVSFTNPNQQEFPAIVQQSYGKGAVLFMGFDTTWRWRREHGDRYFREYWGKVVQFLGLPHLLNEAARNALFLSQETASVGERVTITAKLTNPDYSPYIADKVTLQRRQGEASATLDLRPVPQRPGMYRATDWPREAGQVEFALPSDYQARPASLRVVDQSREFLESGLDRELLTALSATTGGQFMSIQETTARQLLDAIRDGRRPQPVHISDAIWDNWLMLVLCIGLFGVEWLFRKLFYLD